jgi:hypothetical protein
LKISDDIVTAMNFRQASRTEIIRAAEADLPTIAELAGIIWRACYLGIISSEQIEYMLPRMYALDTMQDEIGRKASAMTFCY